MTPAAATAMDPRWDRDFVDTVLWDLVTHANEWRPLGRLYAGNVASFDRCCVIREAVDWGRKLGMDIEGSRRLGYRLVGLCHPRRVYLVKPGRPLGESDVQIPGQLTFAWAEV